MKSLPSAVKRRVGIATFPTDRVHQALKEKDSYFFSHLTRHELEYCRRKRRAEESFAARLAGKIAFWDACAIKNPEKKFEPREWRKIEVQRKRLGPPELAVSAATLKKYGLSPKSRLLLSITHEREFALVVVVIEAE